MLKSLFVVFEIIFKTIQLLNMFPNDLLPELALALLRKKCRDIDTHRCFVVADMQEVID